MRLPFEIIEHIIDFFLVDDINKEPSKARLATIASISPYFLERVRKVRFKKLNFRSMTRNQLRKINLIDIHRVKRREVLVSRVISFPSIF
jgi:hypothetical protein